ncbi:hypothetical protein ColTof3_13444 [Colletotrichum tofieldiae]|nr:hypothetical protein ColTof3_13444 [Colletotrichum tofieldiae]
MQFKFIIATLFASMALAIPAIEQLDALDHPKLVGRPKGGPGSGPSCCSAIREHCSEWCAVFGHANGPRGDG